MIPVNTLTLSGDGSFTLTNGSQAGRAVLILARQVRTPTNLTNYTFNGQAGTVIDLVGENTDRVLATIFYDSDLPASAGDYNVNRVPSTSGGSSCIVFELAGIDSDINNIQSIPLVSATVPPDVLVDFTNPANSLLAIALRQSSASGSSLTGGAGQTSEAVTTSILSYKPEASQNDSLSVSGLNTSSAEVVYLGLAIPPSDSATTTPTLRKTDQQTFDKPAGIGTITAATLNGQAITLDSQDAETFTVTDSDGSITTSGEYDLVATGDTVETITVQVNVVGVAPANNPLSKDGAALADLTDVEVRISAGATLAGTQLFYTGAATTDANGNLGNIDLSDTAADPDDVVLLKIRTAAGDSIIAAETVELI